MFGASSAVRVAAAAGLGYLDRGDLAGWTGADVAEAHGAEMQVVVAAQIEIEVSEGSAAAAALLWRILVEVERSEQVTRAPCFWVKIGWQPVGAAGAYEEAFGSRKEALLDAWNKNHGVVAPPRKSAAVVDRTHLARGVVLHILAFGFVRMQVWAPVTYGRVGSLGTLSPGLLCILVVLSSQVAKEEGKKEEDNAIKSTVRGAGKRTTHLHPIRSALVNVGALPVAPS